MMFLLNIHFILLCNFFFPYLRPGSMPSRLVGPAPWMSPTQYFYCACCSPMGGGMAQPSPILSGGNPYSQVIHPYTYRQAIRNRIWVGRQTKFGKKKQKTFSCQSKKTHCVALVVLSRRTLLFSLPERIKNKVGLQRLLSNVESSSWIIQLIATVKNIHNNGTSLVRTLKCTKTETIS